MFNKRDYIIDYFNREITIITKDIKPRKITGSNFYDIANYGDPNDQYNSQFEAMVSRVLGIRAGIYDTIYIDAGNVYEDLVVDKIKDAFPGYEVTHLTPEDYDYDYFKEEENFGGVPDFLLANENEKIVIDVKTKKKKKNMLIEADPKYVHQVNLYKQLLGYDRALLLYVYLEYPLDYIKPGIDGKVIEIIDVTISDSEVIKNKTKALSNIKRVLNEQKIIGFDVKNNYDLLQILEAKDEGERIERDERLKKTKPIS